MHRTDKDPQHSLVIWSIWLNGSVSAYKLSGCGFESCCCHLNVNYRACFEQGIPWHSGNYTVWIHSETHRWHDKYTQSYNRNLSLWIWSVIYLTMLDFLRSIMLMKKKRRFLSISITCNVFYLFFYFAAEVKIPTH